MTKIPTDPTLAAANLNALAQQKANLQKAKQLANQPLKSEAELDKATQGFEALLLQEMMKSMWKTVEFSGFLGNDSNEAQIYRDMFSQAIADSIAEGEGIGLKRFLQDELLRQEKASKG